MDAKAAFTGAKKNMYFSWGPGNPLRGPRSLEEMRNRMMGFLGVLTGVTGESLPRGGPAGCGRWRAAAGTPPTSSRTGVAAPAASRLYI